MPGLDAASRSTGASRFSMHSATPSRHVVLARASMPWATSVATTVRSRRGWRQKRERHGRMPDGSVRCMRSWHWPSAIASAPAIGMLAFAMHQTWQVRMYTARAAAIVDDVRGARRAWRRTRTTTSPSRRWRHCAELIGAESEQLFVDVLNRTNAHRSPKRGAPVRVDPHRRAGARWCDVRRRRWSTALAGALERISAEQCETSRDTRLALITRLGQLGSVAQASILTPLLKDLDPRVGAAAAAVLAQWTGKAAEIDTPHQKSSNIPTVSELSDRVTRCPSRWTAGAGSISSWILSTRR